MRCEVIEGEYPYGLLINHLNAYAARAHSEILQGPWFHGKLIPDNVWREFATIDVNNRVHEGGEPSLLISKVWPAIHRDGHRTKYVLSTNDGEDFSVWQGTYGLYLRPNREDHEEVRRLLEVKMSHASMTARCDNSPVGRKDVAVGTEDGSTEEMQEAESALPRERPTPTGGGGEEDRMQEDQPPLIHSDSGSSSSDDEDTYVEVNSISIGGQVNTVSSRQNGEREAGDQKK